MVNNYWANVHSPFRKEKGPVGSFHLFVPGNRIIKVWANVKELTRSGLLGYMSSIAPKAMSEGPYEGYTCISVHCEETKKNLVYQDLQMFSLGHLINKYSNYRRKPQQDTVKNEVFYDEAETNENEDEEDKNQANSIDEDLDEDSEENSESDVILEKEVYDDDDTEEEVEGYESMDESDSEEAQDSSNSEDEQESRNETEAIMETGDYGDDYLWPFYDYDDERA